MINTQMALCVSVSQSVPVGYVSVTVHITRTLKLKQLNGIQPSFWLPFTPVLFLLRHIYMQICFYRLVGYRENRVVVLYL